MKKLPKTLFVSALFAVSLVGVATSLRGESPSASKLIIGNPGVAWPALDALGRAVRTVTLEGQAGPRADRTVGIFYFLWQERKSDRLPPDIAKILAQDPDVLQKPDSPLWGRMTSFHYWGEPLYGYYHSDDAWVLRRHARLLVDAGIDTVIMLFPTCG